MSVHVSPGMIQVTLYPYLPHNHLHIYAKRRFLEIQLPNTNNLLKHQYKGSIALHSTNQSSVLFHPCNWTDHNMSISEHITPASTSTNKSLVSLLTIIIMIPTDNSKCGLATNFILQI